MGYFIFFSICFGLNSFARGERVTGISLRVFPSTFKEKLDP